MADWLPPPEPVTWTLPKAITRGARTYDAVTLRAPTPADVLKATAVAGEVGTAVTLRMIAAISLEEVPFDVLTEVPSWVILQMNAYLEAFNGAPLPGPLEVWRLAVQEASGSPPA